MQINKDTKLFGSFSNTPGNNGCKYFNARFQEEGINAIYKSFKGLDAKDIIFSARTLNFSGYALSMPLKISCIPYLDSMNEDAKEINAVNTVLNVNGKQVGYNTDWLGVREYFKKHNINSISIIGTGGFSKAIQYCCRIEGIDYEIFNRENIKKITKAKYNIFNATPANFICDIDGRPNTPTGREIAELQAKEQFKLYKLVL